MLIPSTTTASRRGYSLDHPEELVSKAKLRMARVPWRESFKHGIEKYSESGLMLKGARAKKGLTQKQLAESLGIKTHHVAEMEHGKRSIDEAMAHRLEKVLDMSYRLFI